MHVLPGVSAGIRVEFEAVLARDRYARAHGQRGKQAGDPQTIKRLLTDPHTCSVWRQFRVSGFTDDQVSQFLAAAISLSWPVRRHDPVFTLRQIQRAKPRERAVMERHVAAPGSPHPEIAGYLAVLADAAKRILGTFSYRTVATVAGVVLNDPALKITDLQVRRALRIFTRSDAKARIWHIADLGK